MWNSMEDSNVRGWCEVSIDTIVRLLQSLQLRMRVTPVDQAPFEGELHWLSMLSLYEYACFPHHRRAQGSRYWAIWWQMRRPTPSGR